MTWTLKTFDSLTPYELYAILRLRTEVFVVEQTCVFQDMDNKDQLCYHLMGWKDDLLIAYTRLVPPDIFYKEPSIGRVVTSPAARGNGIGKLLMKKSIEDEQKNLSDMEEQIRRHHLMVEWREERSEANEKLPEARALVERIEAEIAHDKKIVSLKH